MLQEFQKIRCGQKLCWWKEELVFLCGLCRLAENNLPQRRQERKDPGNAYTMTRNYQKIDWGCPRSIVAAPLRK